MCVLIILILCSNMITYGDNPIILNHHCLQIKLLFWNVLMLLHSVLCSIIHFLFLFILRFVYFIFMWSLMYDLCSLMIKVMIPKRKYLFLNLLLQLQVTLHHLLFSWFDTLRILLIISLLIGLLYLERGLFLSLFFNLNLILLYF